MSSSSFNLQTYSIISAEDEKLQDKLSELYGKKKFIKDASFFGYFFLTYIKWIMLQKRLVIFIINFNFLNQL